MSESPGDRDGAEMSAQDDGFKIEYLLPWLGPAEPSVSTSRRPRPKTQSLPPEAIETPSSGSSKVAASLEATIEEESDEERTGTAVSRAGVGVSKTGLRPVPGPAADTLNHKYTSSDAPKRRKFTRRTVSLAPTSSPPIHDIDSSSRPKPGLSFLSGVANDINTHDAADQDRDSDEREARRMPDLDDAQTAQERGGFFSELFDGYESLVNAVIRPPRHEYDDAELGPLKFEYVNVPFERVDHTLISVRDSTLETSWWRRREKERTPRPCFVILHGNSSSRAVAVHYLSFCLSLGAEVFSFDFGGSGRSKGEFVTLGANEVDDLATVVKHLAATGDVTEIILWGRSMGAATALLHERQQHPLVTCMVLDSPFSSLEQLFTDLGERVNVPGWIKHILKMFLRSSIQSRAGFDAFEISPIEHAPTANTPALFLAGVNDTFIRRETHLFPLVRAYGGPREVYLTSGDHNTTRPHALNFNIREFVHANSTLTPQMRLDVNTAVWSLEPWDAALASVLSPRMLGNDTQNYVMDARKFIAR